MSLPPPIRDGGLGQSSPLHVAFGLSHFKNNLIYNVTTAEDCQIQQINIAVASTPVIWISEFIIAS